VPPWVALPESWHARRTRPRAGEASTELGEAPHPLAKEGRRRWMAVGRHRLQGGPRPGCTDDLPGHPGRGTAPQRNGVDTPGHEHGHHQGGQAPLRCLPAPRRTRPPVRQPPAQPCDGPPPARGSARALHEGCVGAAGPRAAPGAARPASPPSSMAARGRQRPRGMEQRRVTRGERDGGPPGLRRGRALMPTRRVLDPPHARLRAAALERGVGMAHPTRPAPDGGGVQTPSGSPRLGPARPRGRQPADGALAPPASEPSAALRGPGRVPLAPRALPLSRRSETRAAQGRWQSLVAAG
jgi:hypothetical protein